MNKSTTTKKACSTASSYLKKKNNNSVKKLNLLFFNKFPTLRVDCDLLSFLVPKFGSYDKKFIFH